MGDSRMEDSREQKLLKTKLADLVKKRDKTCSECHTKQPRWCSTNLGVFFCIRCSGIHRNLGVHISKVKSINLDSWTAEQVKFMESMGNDRANAYWEANMPPSAKPAEHDDARRVEMFIRDKYERKRWAGNPKQLTEASSGSSSFASSEEAEKEKQRQERRRLRRENQPQQQQQQQQRPSVISAPVQQSKPAVQQADPFANAFATSPASFDSFDDFGAFSSPTPTSSLAAPASTTNNANTAAAKPAATPTAFFDLFSDPSPSPASTAQATSPSGMSVSSANGSSGTGSGKTSADIMNLFSSSSSPAPSPYNMHPQQRMYPNFGPAPSPVPSPHGYGAPMTPMGMNPMMGGGMGGMGMNPMMMQQPMSSGMGYNQGMQMGGMNMGMGMMPPQPQPMSGMGYNQGMQMGGMGYSAPSPSPVYPSVSRSPVHSNDIFSMPSRSPASTPTPAKANDPFAFVSFS